jgi:hypothetical protein
VSPADSATEQALVFSAESTESARNATRRLARAIYFLNKFVPLASSEPHLGVVTHAKRKALAEVTEGGEVGDNLLRSLLVETSGGQLEDSKIREEPV